MLSLIMYAMNKKPPGDAHKRPEDSHGSYTPGGIPENSILGGLEIRGRDGEEDHDGGLIRERE